MKTARSEHRGVSVPQEKEGGKVPKELGVRILSPTLKNANFPTTDAPEPSGVKPRVQFNFERNSCMKVAT